MDNQIQTDNQETQNPKKVSIKRILIVLCIIFLLFTSLLFAYLYYSETQKDINTPDPSKAGAEDQPQEDEDNQANEDDEQGDKNQITFRFREELPDLLVKLDYLGEFEEVGDPVFPSHQSYCTRGRDVYVPDCFSYYPNKEIMIKSLADDETIEYQDLKKVANMNDTYYLKREISCDDCDPTGRVISWTPKIQVKGYEAIHITFYYNPTELAGEKTDYNKDAYSRDGGEDCVIDLSKIRSTEEGYLVFSGMQAGESNIDSCETLNNMTTFEISFL